MARMLIAGLLLTFLLTPFPALAAAVPPQPATDGLITLQLKNAPVREAVEKIMSQEGLRYTLAPGNLFKLLTPEPMQMGNPDFGSSGPWQAKGHSTANKAPKINMDMVRAPFWTAMHRLAQQANVSLWNPTNSDETRLRITNQNNLIGPKTPVSIKGDFLTELSGINLSRSVSFMDRRPAVQQQFTLSMIFAIRPNLMILEVLPNQPHITNAVDNRGHALVYPGQIFGDADSQISVPTAQWWASLWLPLRRPPGIGNRIKLLTGTITAIVATGLKQIRYSVVSDKPHSFKTMGVVITVGDMEKVHGYYQVGYSVRVPARLSSKARSIEAQTKIKEAENPLNFVLEDARGRKFQGLAWDQAFQHFTLHFGTNFPTGYAEAAEPVGPPTTLVITLPTNARLVTVPFGFKNVLLP